jgi:pimeloyl-ACP methyl ester carboxylesterase
MNTPGVRIEPFRISIDESVLTDLRDRIRRTLWPMEISGSGWTYGTDLGFVRSLLDTWANAFDWRAQERSLNRLHHARALVDGMWVHVVRERGVGPSPMPLVLTNGWSSSFVEYLDILPLLTDPAAHGGDAADAFDVVIATMPGFGFSDIPDQPLLEPAIGDMWDQLMHDGLGYERFGAHGSDAGTGPTIEVARRHPDHVVGVHLSAFYLDAPPEPMPDVVRDFLERHRQERTETGAYSRMQSARPQTLAYGLTDSPVGLAAWILDVWRAFSDCGGDLDTRFTRDQLLTNLTIYWVTQTIGPSMRNYFDYVHLPPDPRRNRVKVPAGFAVFADSHEENSARPPRELAEHWFDVRRWTVMPRGGHFAALEEPQLLAEELRAFFRPLRSEA